MKQFKKCQLAEIFCDCRHSFILKQHIGRPKCYLATIVEIWKLFLLSSSFSSISALLSPLFPSPSPFTSSLFLFIKMLVCIVWIHSYHLISLLFSAFLPKLFHLAVSLGNTFPLTWSWIICSLLLCLHLLLGRARMLSHRALDFCSIISGKDWLRNLEWAELVADWCTSWSELQMLLKWPYHTCFNVLNAEMLCNSKILYLFQMYFSECCLLVPVLS